MDQFWNYTFGEIDHFLSIFRTFLRKIAIFTKISAILRRNDEFNLTLRKNLHFLQNTQTNNWRSNGSIFELYFWRNWPFLSIFRTFLRKIPFFTKISAILRRNDKFNLTLREHLSFWPLLKIQPIDFEIICPNIHIAPAKVISSFRFFKIRFLSFFYNFYILVTFLSGYLKLKFKPNWI